MNTFRAPLLTRLSIVAAVFLIITFLFIALGAHSRQKYAMQHFVYCSSDENGISLAHYNESTGEISAPQLQPGTAKSFFIATHLTHPAGPRLYSLNAGEGSVQAYAMAADGSLTLLNSVSSQGKVPCHLVVDAKRSLLFVANYNGGTVLLPILKDGSLGEVGSLHLQSGGGLDTRRQAGSHPHGIALAGAEIYVADLGTDEIVALDLTHPAASSTPLFQLATSKTVKLQPGAGPRHITFHHDGRRAVAVNELDNTVTSLIRRAAGPLEVVSSLSTLPSGYAGETWTAEIDFHPHTSVCYASNRGENSLALFEVGPQGELTHLDNVSAGGKNPQHLSLTPSGETLFVANNASNNIVRLPINATTGHPTGSAIECFPLAKPMCVLAVPVSALQR